VAAGAVALKRRGPGGVLQSRLAPSVPRPQVANASALRL